MLIQPLDHSILFRSLSRNPSGRDLEFTGVLPRGLAAGFLHIESLTGCPEKTLADQALGNETDRACAVMVLGGRRGMVHEKQVEVQGVDRDVARLRSDQARQ